MIIIQSAVEFTALMTAAKKVSNPVLQESNQHVCKVTLNDNCDIFLVGGAGTVMDGYNAAKKMSGSNGIGAKDLI